MRKIKMATKVAAKKAMVLGFILSMVAGLTACGENDEKQDRMTTAQAISTEKEVDVDVVEPNDHIDEVFSEETTEVTTEEVTEATTEATTEAANNGGYAYTTYGVDVTLPVNIDDYISRGKYAPDSIEVFDIVKLAEDFGWEVDSHLRIFRYYGENDIMIELSLDEGDALIPGFEDYYDDSEKRHSATVIGYNTDFVDCQYILYFENYELVASRDDAVFLALYLTFTKEHPGENPMGYFDFSSFETDRIESKNAIQYTFLR